MPPTVRFAVVIAALFGSCALGWRLSEPSEPNTAAAVEEAPLAVEPDATIAVSEEMFVQTRRHGSHHVVEAQISGPGGNIVEVTLLVDTGATMVVLPASMMETLGYNEFQLRTGLVQTARGRSKVKIGELHTIEVGGPENPAAAEDVEVAFVRDSHLGSMGLLGMSFLGNFRVTLDDRNDQIVLTASR